MNVNTDTILDEIQQLRHLEPDWDSYGADSIDRSALDRAAQFVLRTTALMRLSGMEFPTPEVGPAPDAGVSLLWPDRGLGEVEARFSPYGDRFVVVQNLKLVNEGGIIWEDGFLKSFIDRYLRY
jgi:hypothetical protein